VTSGVGAGLDRGIGVASGGKVGLGVRTAAVWIQLAGMGEFCMAVLE
jgi:hypothetical protein